MLRRLFDLLRGHRPPDAHADPSNTPAGEATEPPLRSILEGILRRHDLCYGVVFTADGTVLADAGSPGGLVHEGLASSLLGPRGSLANTFYATCDEQYLPQQWAQGGDVAIVDVLSARVGAVYLAPQGVPRGSDAIERYHWVESVAVDARRAIARVPGLVDPDYRPGHMGPA